MEQVFDTVERCSGCAACAYVCPRDAIRLQEDEYGYRYPVIDREKCIDCGRCAATCHFRHPLERNAVKACLAGQSRDERQLKASSSGGIFPALAKRFLQDGGVVCGAAMSFEEDGPTVRHVLVDRVEDLPKLQGSKYVQSRMDEIYAAIGERLKQGSKVLFSGTPCQVAAVKRVFSRQEDRLFCVDIVCHGVPSERSFRDYIALEEKRTGASIRNVTFRDKNKGWGHRGSYTEVRKEGEKQKDFSPQASSYFHFFLDGELCRESCYACPYANTARIGDLTLGDYWGIDRFDPELLTGSGGPMKKELGVSCILVNTEKGNAMLQSVETEVQTYPVEIDHLLVVNTQLREPAKHSKKRDKILAAYKENGYSGVDKLFRPEYRIWRLKKIVKKIVKKILPPDLIKKL